MDTAFDNEDLFEDAPCGLINIAPDGRVLLINRRQAEWLGTAPDAVVGNPFRNLLNMGGRIAFETHLAPLLRMRGSVEEIALDLLHADGRKIPFIANAVEQRDENGRHLFTRLALLRAVERRSYERTLREARQQAESATTAEQETANLREQFIAVLGHDLRNPLAALLAGTKLIGERETVSDRGRFVLREMTASLARASALVENLMDFARGRLGGGLTLALNSSEPLTPTLEQVVAEVRAIYPDRKILTRFAIEEPVKCDPSRLAQLASNLISNAITHGGADRPILVEAATHGKVFRFSVENHGPPISDQARTHLFEPFFRGSNRRSQQGLGLGLFIVSQIAAAHGGRMEVISDDDRTKFEFTMPQAV